MKSKKILTLLGVLALSCSIALSGCGNKAEETNAKEGFYDGTTQIGCTTWVGYAPLLVAQEMGFFEENGVKTEIKVIEDAGNIKSAVLSGELQGMAQTIDTEAMAEASGIDLEAVLALCNSNGGDGVVAKKEFNSLKDLKGHSVALNTTGGASLFWYCYVLDEQGLTLDDFKIQTMTSSEAGAAFAGGSVDAAVTWEPWLTTAENTDFGKTLVSSADYPGIIVDALALTPDYIEKYPESVKGLVNAWYEAVDFINSNPKEAYPIMEKYLSVDEKELVSELATIEYYDLDMNKDYVGGGKMTEMASFASELWYKLELTNTEIDGEALVNTSFYSGK